MFPRKWLLACVMCLTIGSLAMGQPVNPSDTLPVHEPDYYFSHGIIQLIYELGNSSYAKRQHAYKNIEMFGPMALKQLRRVKKTSDVEFNRRVEELIRRAEEQVLHAQILAPKEVQVNWKNISVQQAIAELSSKSGYAIQFQGDATKFADKKINLLGKMPFWIALDRLCDQAGLLERGPGLPYGAGDTMPYRGKPAGAPVLPIVLVNRGNEKSIVSHAGAVKTELRITRDKSTKDLILQLSVRAEPGLVNPLLEGEPILQSAIDDRGRNLAKADAPKPSYETTYYDRRSEVMQDLNWFIGNSAVIRLKDTDQAAKHLKVLAGRLTMSVDLQNERLARIENVFDAAGKSVDATNGGKMKVLSAKKKDNGLIEVQVMLENMGQNPFGGNIMVNGNGGVNIRGNVIIRGGGMVIGPNGVNGGGNGSTKDLPDLLDAKGQKFKALKAADDSFQIVNGSSSRTATVVYQPNPGQAEPRDLVLFGTRTHIVAVPFRFEDVPLP